MGADDKPTPTPSCPTACGKKLPRTGLTTKIEKSVMRSLKQCIDSLDWPQQGRPTSIGEGKCLGITSLPTGKECEYAHDRAIISCREEHVELIKLVNATLLAAYGHKNTVSTPHRDVAIVGPSAITIFGEFDGGELYINDRLQSDSKHVRYEDGVTMYTGRDEWFLFD